MWIKRDFESYLLQMPAQSVHPIKVLKGPRQVGKTSLLEHSGKYQIVQLDDFQTRQRALENPRFFLDQLRGPLVLDEATLVPDLFLELKRRVDEFRKEQRSGRHPVEIDIWITGSNQTLLEKAVQESLAGRASYFDLNTLSIHELGHLDLGQMMIKGGWPELHSNQDLSPSRYLNDLVATFIERDIVSAAGIERKAAFAKTTGLLAGRVGQMLNAADIAKNVGVETTTVQSWFAKLQQNAVIRIVQPYYTNLNQRLIKTPKIYFEDVGLATRLQGWTEFNPLYVSPSFGHLLENLAVIEVCRFYSNQGLQPEIFFLRSKEKVEIDILAKLPNSRWLAIEVKSTPIDMTPQQRTLIEKTELNVIERWVVSPTEDMGNFEHSRSVPLRSLHDVLQKIF